MPSPKRVPTLVEFGNGELDAHAAFDVLSNAREENAWLANFSSHNTRQTYRRAIASFVATLDISSPDDLYKVKQAHVIAWRSSMEAAGLSQGSIANRLSSLSSLYRHLTDTQLVPANPCAGVRRPKTGNLGIGAGKSPTLSRRQVRAFLDAPDTQTIQGLRDRALLHVFFYVGARCSEPAKLRVKDFGYDAEFPVLTLTIKGNKTNSVAINLECARALREYLDIAPHGQNPEALLFQPVKNGNKGASLHRSQLYNLFKRYAVKAGIDHNVFPHMARATMITSAFEAGCAGEDIQRTVGHASITTTEGYNHTAQKHRQSASLKIGY
ncbi:tyrosine-type recombinase/integrase [uncultured Tateyamaria sp.]|uniref:tyrosine-type recombinase/integrase n=1 Tax=uncultured Tateyamaria sp. TaxID=455651 RepID=UPI00260900DD|nr:tyrosine-type recombinase/integrase [uncultured Tateyamaria sp.]